MGKTLNLSDEERIQFSRDIENFLEFTRDVLNDPSILKHIPSGSQVDAIPNGERDPERHYDIETPRMVATVTPPRKPAHIVIHRNCEMTLKRARAAHR